LTTTSIVNITVSGGTLTGVLYGLNTIQIATSASAAVYWSVARF
jgi:hypothetical protein